MKIRMDIPCFKNTRELQLISTEPKLQISTLKTKYLATSHFADIVNISVLHGWEQG